MLTKAEKRVELLCRLSYVLKLGFCNQISVQTWICCKEISVFMKTNVGRRKNMLIPEVDPLSKTTTQSISKRGEKICFSPEECCPDLSWWGQTVIGYVCDILIFGGGEDDHQQTEVRTGVSSFRASSITRVQNTPTLRKKEGGGEMRGGSGCLVRPYFTITSISQQSMTNGGFSAESPCLIFILCRVHISKCLHFCRSETVWIPIEFGPPAEQLAWRCIRQTVPWDLLVSFCPALSHSSPQSWSMSCSITQLAGASTTGHHPFPSSSFC